MLLDLIKLTIGLLIPLVVGYALMINIIEKSRVSKSIFIPAIYGLGIGIVSQWTLLLGVMRIPFTREMIGIPLLLISLALIISPRKFPGPGSPGHKILPRSGRRSPGSALREEFLSLSGPSRFLILALVLILGFKLAYILFQSLNLPVYAWDPMYFSTYKAKVIFHQKSLAHLENFPHSSYPLLTQFAEVWVSLNLGEWHDQYLKIIFPFFSLSFLLMTYGFISSSAKRIWGLLSCFLLTSSNLFVLHSTISYRDLTLMFYTCGAVMFLILWRREGNDGFLYIASLFSGLGTFTKLEGGAYFFLHLILVIFLLGGLKNRKIFWKLSQFFKFLIPAGGIYLFFNLYKSFLGIRTEKLGLDFSWEHINRIPIIGKRFFGELFFSADWGIIWFVLVLSLVLNLSRIRKDFAVKFLLIALTSFFIFYFFYCLVSPNYRLISGEHYLAALPRIILHFFPLSVWIVALLNRRVFGIRRDRET